MSELFVPEAVRTHALHHAGDMGGPEPTATLVRFRTWRFTWQDARVMVYVEFRWHGRDRVRWAGTKLVVDGVERPSLTGHERFRVLWTGGSYEEAAGLVDERPAYAPSEVADELPFEDAPPVLRNQLEELTAKFGDTARIRYGRSGAVHTMAMDVTDRQSALRFRMQGAGLIVKPVEVELWIDGLNMSSAVGNDIAKAIALLRSSRDPGQQAPSGGPPVSGAAAAQGYTSADVRRHSVIRT